MTRSSVDMTVRIFGGPEDTGVDAEVDAEILARILHALQRVVHILGMDNQNRDVSSTAYIPQDIQEKFPLRCLLPQKGSYAMPLLVGRVTEFWGEEELSEVVGKMLGCLTGLVRGRPEPYSQVRNGRFRVPILNALRGMLPKPGSTWKIGVLSRGQQEELIISDDCYSNVSLLRELLRQTEIVAQTVTGHLQAMDFEAHKITVLYPENNRELDCFYEEEMELELLETRRGLVQVTGTVVVDAENSPEKIQDVTSIQPLDLSAFEIHQLTCGGRHFEFAPRLSLIPKLTESKQYMVLQHEDLGIGVIAATREDLFVEIQQQIDMLWSEYALEEDANLTESARKLKQSLRTAIHEVPHNEC